MHYIHQSLDRADHFRKDDYAAREFRRRATTRVLPVWRGNVLVTPSDANTPPVLASLPADVAIDHSPAEEIFLGMVGDTAYFALNCNVLDDKASANLARNAVDMAGQAITAQFSDLRVVGPHLPADEGALLAYARGMNYWLDKTRFCSRCGAGLHSRHSGHVKSCGKTDCQHTEFPRTDPAVIMLVTHTPANGSELCLLGRSPAWPEGVFSTLAGFVEPGESLEQAVQREVYEEAAILTDNVRYISSQPWPFPRSIMLGFQANASTTDIVCNQQELADARWFTREELKAFGNWGDDRFALQLPRTDSIARSLINRWLNEAEG